MTEGFFPVGVGATGVAVRFTADNPDAWESEPKQNGFSVLWKTQEASWGRFVVIGDPDDRPVVLVRMNRHAFERFVLPEEKVAAGSLCPTEILINLVQGATMRACGEMLVQFYDEEKRYFKGALAEQELQNVMAASARFLQSTETDYVQQLPEREKLISEFFSARYKTNSEAF